jgi:hypothetical protein
MAYGGHGCPRQLWAQAHVATAGGRKFNPQILSETQNAGDIFPIRQVLTPLSLTCQHARHRLAGECVPEWMSCVGHTVQSTNAGTVSHSLPGDYDEADGERILTFWQAQDLVREKARIGRTTDDLSVKAVRWRCC